MSLHTNLSQDSEQISFLMHLSVHISYSYSIFKENNSKFICFAYLGISLDSLLIFVHYRWRFEIIS